MTMRSCVLALLILLDVSFVLGKSVHFQDSGRSFLLLSFFSFIRVQNLVPFQVQEHTEGRSAIVVVLVLSFFRCISPFILSFPVANVHLKQAKKCSNGGIFRKGRHGILISFDQCYPKCGSWLSCEHISAWTCPFLDAASCTLQTYKCRRRQNLDSIDRIVLNIN